MSSNEERIKDAAQTILGGMVQDPRGGSTKIETNHLQEILDMQHKFMELLNYGHIPNSTENQLETMSVALADEAFEILRELNWKPWKKPKPVNYPKLKEEVIDALHFIMEMCILLHMDSHEILQSYKAKMAENINRQIRGY